MTPCSTILEIVDLCKSLGAAHAIDHLSLSVRQGEIFGILGPRGAGKTTLFELFSSKAVPTSGTIKVMGEGLWRKSTRVLRYVGAVPTPQRDVNILDGDHTAREHLHFHAELLGVPPLKYPERISTTLEVVRLAAYENIRVGAFSAEMKRRLALARALLHDPPFVLMDEPTAGVSEQDHQAFWGLLRSLQDAGKNIVLTTLHGRRHSPCVIGWPFSPTGRSNVW